MGRKKKLNFCDECVEKTHEKHGCSCDICCRNFNDEDYFKIPELSPEEREKEIRNQGLALEVLDSIMWLRGRYNYDNQRKVIPYSMDIFSLNEEGYEVLRALWGRNRILFDVSHAGSFCATGKFNPSIEYDLSVETHGVFVGFLYDKDKKEFYRKKLEEKKERARVKKELKKAGVYLEKEEKSGE